jgi:hypothetical protein
LLGIKRDDHVGLSRRLTVPVTTCAPCVVNLSVEAVAL